MRFYKTSAAQKKPLFITDGRSITIDGVSYTGADIKSISVTANLGRFFPVRKNCGNIDALTERPPLHALKGSVVIEMTTATHSFNCVYRVMEAYMLFKRLFPAVQAWYSFRGVKLAYRYKGGINDDFFDKHKNFASVYVLDKNTHTPKDYIIQIKQKWAEKCGFRQCADNESCCFDEVLYFSPDDPWITIYDDSIEHLLEKGVVNQCSIYSCENPDRDIILVSVYEGRALFLAHSFNDDVAVFYCGSDEDAQFLHKSDNISEEYDRLEALKAEDTPHSFKQLLCDDMDMDERLTEIAHRLGINDYFIRAGFYDISCMSHAEMMEFANGYKSVHYRIRPNEKSVKGVYDRIYQGSPAFDAFRSDGVLVSGKRFEAEFVNTGSYSRGIAFAVRSKSIHRDISNGIASGGGFSVKISGLTISGYMPKDDKYIYRSINAEAEYRMFFGAYALVYEDDSFDIAPGTVINKDHIKTDADKEAAREAHTQASIKVSFILDTPYADNCEVWLIPMSNVYDGGARFIVKTERK
ncbi:MAG: hypothetical protein IKS17_04525 [Firmicutes bacterium]|nr:hypothetical protein [Bacillota bacterium]